MINRVVKLGFFVLPALALLIGSPLRAMNLDTYDLDSMAYMSTDIVEGDVGQWHKYENKPDDPQVMDFKVISTLKGTFKAGDVFPLEAMDFYVKSKGFTGNSEKLKSGDHLVIFCSRAKSVFLYDIPKDAVIYWTVPGGVRLLLSQALEHHTDKKSIVATEDDLLAPMRIEQAFGVVRHELPDETSEGEI